MENASKALIIAGAILISIVLVSVGVLVVQRLNPDQAIDEISAQEIEAFNSKFITSAGNNKQGSIARSLLSTIMTNNQQNSADTSRQIKVTISNTDDDKSEVTAANDLSKIRNAINTNSRYDISYTVKDSGLVDVITITKK